jgi:hypothetical protein
MATGQSKTRSRSHCPRGTNPRRAYTRKNGKAVRSTCVPIHNPLPSVGGHPTTCREGEIPRIAHSRKYIEGGIQKVAHIPASCVRRQSLIRPLHKGDLKKYGYSYKGSNITRRNALHKAVQAYGALTTYHKLNAVAKLSGTQYPKIAHVFAQDRNWIRSEYSKNGVLSR